MQKSIIYTFLIGLMVGMGMSATWQDWREPETERLFVYGTLTTPLIRHSICLCHTPTTPATLQGYEQRGLNIIPTSNSAVEGRLLQVSRTELFRFDRYEGVPHRYERIRVTIGDESAWVYQRTTP